MPTRNAHKAARLAAIYLLIRNGELDLDATSQSELARRFGEINRSTILKDLRALPDVARLVDAYIEAYHADEAAGIRE